MNPSTISRSRITAVALGYIVMLAGALSLFTLSFYSTFGLLAIGTAITLLSDRTSIPMTRTSWTLLLAGFVVIFCVLSLFGQERIRHWTPFPAGYIPAWMAIFHGFRHIRHLLLQQQKKEPVVSANARCPQ
jgi:hypothetical protein